jgi:hypothetical protein
VILNPNKEDHQFRRLNDLLLAIYHPRGNEALSLWVAISSWIRQKEIKLPSLIIILLCYLRAIQAIDVGKPIPISMAWYRYQCRLLVNEQAQRIRLGLPTSSIEQLLAECKTLLEPRRADYERFQQTFERADTLRSDDDSKAGRRKQLDELMQAIYSQQKTRKDKASLSLWADVTNCLGQNELDLEASDIFLLCYFQAIDAIAAEEPISISMAWMREQCNRTVKEQAQLFVDGMKFSYVHDIVSETLEARYLEAENGDYRLLDQQEIADVAFQSLSQNDQEILRLRLFEGLSYSDIQLRLLQTSTHARFSIGALRKRVSRAIRRLRKAYALLLPQ